MSDNKPSARDVAENRIVDEVAMGGVDVDTVRSILSDFEKEVREPKEKAEQACLDIYGDYAKDELQTIPPSIRHAWAAGKLLEES